MKKFTTSFTGYSKNEVNGFINEVTKEYESMLNNLKNKDKEIERLQKELEHYKDLENTLKSAIMKAEETSDNIKRMARDESEMIVSDAKHNANRIVNEARTTNINIKSVSLQRVTLKSIQLWQNKQSIQHKD